MNIDVTLGLAEPADIPNIMQLYRHTILTVCRKDYGQKELDRWADLGSDEHRWENRIASQYFLVAKDPSGLLGFASLSVDNYIDVLYVSSKHQRLGIASLLFEAIHAKAMAKPIHDLTADVSKTAKPFFEKKGFLLVKEQENLLDDVLIVNYKMRKDLINLTK